MLELGIVLQNRYRILSELGTGGFGYTYEVEDLQEPNASKKVAPTKVLKVLRTDYPQAIELFQREAKVLSQLNHPGIAKIEADGYFVSELPDRAEQLHCLVMEKIPGCNLKQWLKQRQGDPISEDQAVNWLNQLLDILAEIHEQQCFHRDIKPSNIMLKPNGKLVLIDFGSVREVTTTYLAKREENRTDTAIGTRGYSAPEQGEGHAVPQSDFFALGRTFVHLVTGSSPSRLDLDLTTYQLQWRQDAPHISSEFADLLDALMAHFPKDRPQTVPEILALLATGQAIAERKSQITSNTSLEFVPTPQPSPPPQLSPIPSNTALEFVSTTQPSPQSLPPSSSPSSPLPKPPDPFPRPPLKVAMALGVGIVAATLGMRQLGWLQVWELQAWDVLTILRPREPMDDRFLIITVTPEDVQNQNAEERRAASLSDQALEQLLQKINQYNPRVIGLDLYRDFPLDDPETTPELLMQLTSNDTLVSVCQLAAHGSEEGIPAPPEIPKTDPSTRLGFSDVVVDELLDGPLRRQLLVASPDDACPALLSFNLLVALHYLDREGHQLSWGEEGDVPWQVSIGDVTFPSLQPNSGSYQRLDTAGSQIFLNYRSVGDPKNIAKTLTVADVLEHGRLTAADVADRIVLIGSADPLISYDAHFTPYSQTSLPDIPGVFLQAHMISQLVSAVLDDRPILTAGSEGQEIAWISLWSIVGIGWAGWAKSRLLLGLGIGILGLSLGLCCYGFLILGWWIPSVPALLGLSIGSGLMVLYRLKG